MSDNIKNDVNNYNADQIELLEGLEAVRKRPGMYIGSTAREGLHHLVTEIVNNSMDEAIAGHANHIKVEFFKDGSVAVYDNGRGIPFGINEKHKRSALEMAFTELHAGGKFGGSGYKISSGLHGVGASVVNALSKWCRVISKRGDETVIQEYKNGGHIARPVEALDPKNPTKIDAPWSINIDNWNYKSGTIVHFFPDSTIFETIEFKTKFFQEQLRDYAYLTASTKFELIDYNQDQQFKYFFENGVKTFLRTLNKNRELITPEPFYTKTNVEDVDVEVAFQYTDSYSENVLTFANHLKTGEGGTHLTGFKTALTKGINDYAKKQNLFKDKSTAALSGEDIREGLTAIVSVKIESEGLQYEGQTKSKLGNSIARQAVETAVKESLETYLEEHPREAKAIIEKNLLALRARMAAKAARETIIRKSALEGGGVLPGKLADCTERDPEKTEIFIVEGDSAGGTAKDARDRHFQAILPIFGKILNTERARLDKVIEADKYKMLIVAIGTGIGESYDPKKLRYNKIILMADADTDGSHITTLYMTFFYRHMPEIVQGGHLYLAMPPLYKATWGKNKKYLFDDAEREKFLKTSDGDKAVIQRFKGLGEMNSEELEETTMDPKTRKIKQITIDDANKADEVFSILMGSDVPPRKKFIQTHAKNANIDIT